MGASRDSMSGWESGTRLCGFLRSNHGAHAPQTLSRQIEFSDGEFAWRKCKQAHTSTNGDAVEVTPLTNRSA